MRQGILNFPFFSKQLKTADHKYTNDVEPICTQEDITSPPNDRQLVMLTSQMYDDTTTATGISNRAMHSLKIGTLIFVRHWSHWTSGQVEIDLNNFTDHPYTLKRGSHVANFSVMTPGQMEFDIDPVTTWHVLQANPQNPAL